MSDDLVKRLRNPPFGTESSERNLMASAADALDTQAAEIARLRAALATARREGMEEAASEAQARAKFWMSGTNKEAKIRHDEARKIAAAILAAAQEGKP